MTVHHTGHGVTLHHGDCLQVLRELPDNSVDSVVTDPPYGLEFMGKEWDRLGNIGKASHQGFTDGSGFKGFRLPTGYNASANVKCEICAKWRYDHVGRKCECGPAAVWPNVKAHQGRAMQDWHHAWAAECLRVLKPGGHLLAFGGTRTSHRLACAIEDAGFEIRDSIVWLYGSGFPKSLDVGKAIDKAAGATREVVGVRTYAGGHVQNSSDSALAPPIGTFARVQDRRDESAPATPEAAQWAGWGTALKPAHEPIVVARKPLAGTVANNVLTHGTGALNIDGCRIGTGTGETRTYEVSDMRGGNFGQDKAAYADREKLTYTTKDADRWPANVVLDDTAAAALDQQSGGLQSGANPTRRGSDKFRNAYGDFPGQEQCDPARGADTGGASRFYYTAKADATERPRVAGTAHPTVKPLDLMRWLVRLVTPPGGTVLEPFAGSGTTVEAALLEGVQCIAIEREADYLPLILSRLHRQRDPVAFVKLAGDPAELTLFDEEPPA